MRLQLGFNFSDLTKALDGWFGMVQAFKLRLREELSTENFPSILSHAVLGCALLFTTAMILFVGMFAVSAVQVWELLKRVLPTVQRQWQPSNELSPPA